MQVIPAQSMHKMMDVKDSGMEAEEEQCEMLSLSCRPPSWRRRPQTYLGRHGTARGTLLLKAVTWGSPTPYWRGRCTSVSNEDER